MEKLTKKNSIIFNQLWINKILEDGLYHLLPYQKPNNNLSIGEYLENKYNDNYDETQKVTKHNSLLFEREWYLKFKEEGLHIPKKNPYSKYSQGEILSLKYFEIELIREYKESEKNKCLKLNNL